MALMSDHSGGLNINIQRGQEITGIYTSLRIERGDTIMRRVPKVVIGLMLVFLLSGLLLACTSDQTEDANTLVDSANRHVDQYNEIAGKIEDKFDEIADLPDIQEEYEDALAIAEDVDKKVKDKKKEIEGAISDFGEASKLDISDEFETYLKKVKEATEVKLEENEVEQERVDEIIDMFEALVNGTSTEDGLINSLTAITELEKEANELDEKAQDIKDKAEDYYTDQGLGG